MNDIERNLRALLEGVDIEDETQELNGRPTPIALNNDAGLARALGAQTLNGNQI